MARSWDTWRISYKWFWINVELFYWVEFKVKGWWKGNCSNTRGVGVGEIKSLKVTAFFISNVNGWSTNGITITFSKEGNASIKQ